MECTEKRCKSQTQVVDSRESGNSVRRRRRCLKKGHRFTTYEMAHADYDRLAELEAKWRNLQLLLKDTIE